MNQPSDKSLPLERLKIEAERLIPYITGNRDADQLADASRNLRDIVQRAHDLASTPSAIGAMTDEQRRTIDAALAQFAQCISVLAGNDMTRHEVMVEESRPALKAALLALREAAPSHERTRKESNAGRLHDGLHHEPASPRVAEIAETLRQIASKAWWALDASEEHGEGVTIPSEQAIELQAALDALDALPEVPGYSATGPAKAEHWIKAATAPSSTRHRPEGTPERIYLQHDPEEMGGPFVNDGVTWCWHRINKNDLEYVLAPTSAIEPIGIHLTREEIECLADLHEGTGHSAQAEYFKSLLNRSDGGPLSACL